MAVTSGRAQSAATVDNTTVGVAFKAATNSGTNGAPVRGMWIRCDSESASSLWVAHNRGANFVGEGTTPAAATISTTPSVNGVLTLAAGEETTIWGAGSLDRITEIYVLGVTGTATFSMRIVA